MASHNLQVGDFMTSTNNIKIKNYYKRKYYKYKAKYFDLLSKKKTQYGSGATQSKIYGGSNYNCYPENIGNNIFCKEEENGNIESLEECLNTCLDIGWEEQMQQINDEDIMYQDEDVRILYPHIKKGILVFTKFSQPENINICETGLKTGKQLHDEGVYFGRSVYHPYIFFRVPFRKKIISYSSVDDEIISSYGNSLNILNNNRNLAFIRVDPNYTSVYSSEIRARLYKEFSKHPERDQDKFNIELNNSRKTLTDYLNIIKKNEKVKKGQNQKILYNLYTSKAQIFPIQGNPPYPLDKYKIQYHTEVLVRIPHMTPDYFVSCNNVVLHP